MTSKKWAASVLVVLVGSPFAVAALDAIGIGPNWEVEAPEWEAGYSWTYANSVDLQVEARASDMEDESGSLRMTGESKRTVVNTTAMLHDVPLYAVVEQWVPRKIVEDGETVFESDDEMGDLNESEDTGMGFGMDAGGMFVASDSCMFECGTTNAYYTRDDINPYHEEWEWDSGNELRLLEFPLKHGSSWSVYRDEEGGMGPGQTLVHEVRAHVAGRDVVNLPGIGGMEAIRIEAGLTDESIESLESLIAQVPGMSIEFDIDYRLTYWYAPEARTLVRLDMDRMEEFSMSYDGERMGFKGEFRMRDVLTDYSLEAISERSLEESNQLRFLLDDLPGVTELSEESWPFTLAASSLSTDVSNGQGVSLGIREGDQAEPLESGGFDTLPDGMSLKWRHRYMEPVVEEESTRIESKEDWYSGEELDLSLDAGVHQVVAYLLDENGRLVDLDSVLLEGYEEQELSSGLPVGLAQTGELSHGFTASPFLERIYLSVRPGEVGAGQLFVYDETEGGSSAMDVYSASGTNSFMVEGDPEMEGKHYRAGYRDYARAGTADLTVKVSYDRDIDEEEFEERWRQGEKPVRVRVEAHGSLACPLGLPGCLFQELASTESPQDLRGSLVGRLGLSG